jgi:hypothetical protein
LDEGAVSGWRIQGSANAARFPLDFRVVVSRPAKKWWPNGLDMNRRAAVRMGLPVWDSQYESKKRKDAREEMMMMGLKRGSF